MPKFRLEQLKPGMVVSEEARTLSGELILEKATVLTDKNINILKAWGIPQISIQTHSPSEEHHPDLLSADPDRVAEVKSEIEGLFAASTHDHAAIQELKRLAMNRKLVV